VDTSLEPVRSSNSITGYSLTSHGWSDIRSRPFLNVLQLNTKGALFVAAVNSSGEKKSVEYNAGLLSQHLEQLGAKDCVLVIAESASNCKAAGALIKEK
jgi:hypothetical protein